MRDVHERLNNSCTISEVDSEVGFNGHRTHARVDTIEKSVKAWS